MRSYLAIRIAAQSVPSTPDALSSEPHDVRRQRTVTVPVVGLAGFGAPPAAARAPRSHVACLRFGAWIVAAALGGSSRAIAAPAARQQQYPLATEVRAVYSLGHTFLTWKETSLYSDETYVVYESDAPFTSVADADPIVFNGESSEFSEIPEDSSRFYADMVPVDDPSEGEVHEHCVWPNCCPDFEKRHTGRLWARDVMGDPYKLTNGRGVLVLTPTTAGTRYYAVTTILPNGTHNTALSTANKCSVVESVGDPEPLLLDDDEDGCPSSSVRVYLQYMNPRDWNVTLDAPNRLNCYYGFDDPLNPSLSKRMTEAIQYAYTYEVAIPTGTPPLEGWPVTLVLHGTGGVQEDCTVDEGCVLIRPYDYMSTQWYGYARNYDYRTADPDIPIPVYPERGSDVIVNYTEQRVLRALYDTCRLLPTAPGVSIDLDCLYVRGHSMGGGGTLGMALRYPDIFAAAHASKPPTAFGDDTVSMICQGDPCFITPPPFTLTRFYWGDFESPECERVPNEAYLLLPPTSFADNWDDILEYYAQSPSGGSFNVYQWQDHRAHMEGSATGSTCTVPPSNAPFDLRLFDDMVPFGAYHSYDDPIVRYCLHAEPLYAKLNAGLRSAAAEYLDSGAHVNQTVFVPGKPIQYPPELTYSFSFGMPPPLAADANNVPFHGYMVVRNETVPGLRVEGLAPPAPACVNEAFGSLLQEIDWRSTWHPLANSLAQPPVDDVDDELRWQMFFDNTGSSDITVDITPRRLQHFVPSEAELPYTLEVWYVQDGPNNPAVLLDPGPSLVVEPSPDERVLLIVDDLTLKPDKTYRVMIMKPEP
jgi:pimeloyl-ACP methyl ester carboxylesterase